MYYSSYITIVVLITGANAMVLTNFVRRTASRFSMDNKPEEAATICRTHSYTMRETYVPTDSYNFFGYRNVAL